MDKIELLRYIPIFVGLSELELGQLANLTVEEKFPNGSDIVVEDEFANNMYIIVYEITYIQL